MPTTIPIRDVPPGEVRSVEVDGAVVAVCNVDGRFYAFDGACPHAGGPLGEGFLQGTTLTCPWHGWQFDVATGSCTFAASISLERYGVTIRDDQLEITAPARDAT